MASRTCRFTRRFRSTDQADIGDRRAAPHIPFAETLRPAMRAAHITAGGAARRGAREAFRPCRRDRPTQYEDPDSGQSNQTAGSCPDVHNHQRVSLFRLLSAITSARGFFINAPACTGINYVVVVDFAFLPQAKELNVMVLFATTASLGRSRLISRDARSPPS